MAKKKAIKLATATAIAASAFAAAAPVQTSAAVNVDTVVKNAVKKMVAAQNSFVAKATDKKLVDVKTVQANQAAATKEYKAAKATVKKSGGKNTAALNAKLDAAKKTMDYRIKMYVDARKEVSALAVVNQATKKETDIAKLEGKVKELEAQLAKTEKLVAKVIGASTRDKMTALAVTPSKATLTKKKAELEAAQTPKVESVSAINKTKVEVTFSKEVDSVKAENFTIEGASVTAATLSADKKKATIEVSGLDYDKTYTVNVKGVLVNGTATDLGSKEFKSLAVADLWKLEISPKASSLLADGADNTEVTFKLINKATGEVDKDADNMVLDLNTTYGTLASKRVTIQDGQATVLLTSEFSNTNLSAKIDAQIIEASGDYKALIGKVVGTTSVSLVTSNTENVETITLVSAESNQADRVSLFFDKAVSLKHVVAVDADGELLYNVDTDGDGTADVTSLTAKQVLAGKYTADQIYHQLKASNTIAVTQGGAPLKVKGVRTVAGNSKALEVIFDSANDNKQTLKDNATVNVAVNTVNSLGKATPSSAEFKLTDARKPEATSVKTEGLNTLKVKFSEALLNTDFGIDGKYSGVKEKTAATIDAKVTQINQPFVDAINNGTARPALDSSNAFVYATGDFNPVTAEDQRDLATIKLTKNYDEDGIVDTLTTNTTLAGYFAAGTHSLQASSIKDYAWLTDAANLGSTQTLNFTIAADSSKPTATVSVESPEQMRVKFDKTVDGLQKSDFKVQIFNTATGEYEDITASTFAGQSGLTNFNNLLEIDQVSGSEYVLELNEDWTEIYKTDVTRKNYYNDKFRIVVAKGAVSNVANGLKNEVINLDLNYNGSPLNTPDTASPEVTNVKLVSATDGKFEVTMSEPVKAVVKNGNNDVEADLSGVDTKAQGQTLSQASIVYLYGKDKNGATVTFTGKVTGYTDDNGADKVLAVVWNPITDANGTHTPQSIVNAGGSTDWKISVANLTDDVGNAASTKVFNFTIAKEATAATPFFVDHNGATGAARVYKVDGKLNGSGKDEIKIKFSEGVQIAGISNATNPAQYTLNGVTLPAGTSITAADADGNAANGKETVTITLPDGTLNKLTSESNTITINKGLVSFDGSVITGETQLIVNLSDAVDPALQAVVDAANTAKTTANNEVLAVAGIATLSTQIGDVNTAKTTLDAALAASPQVIADITAATNNLKAKTNALVAAGKVIASAPVTLTQVNGGTVGTPTYADAAAVIAALPNKVTVTLVNGTTVDVPVTWADTDTYNKSAASSYTFTATFGTLPTGVTNPNTVAAPTVEVVVAP